jgi:predicted DNA-binding antitoxin AbrB/MazE fold protein
MSENIRAIYENGVLRPLVPLDLMEREVVWVSVEKRDDDSKGAVAVEITEQQQAIGDLLQRMERLKFQAPKDGFSNRDHDQVLYPKTR